MIRVLVLSAAHLASSTLLAAAPELRSPVRGGPGGRRDRRPLVPGRRLRGRRQDRGRGRPHGRQGHAAHRRPRPSSSPPASSTCSGQSEYNVLVDPRAASKITQGITTEITGEGRLDRPHQRPDARRGQGSLRALRRHPGLHHPRRLLEGLRAGQAGDQPGHVRGRRGRPQPDRRRKRPPRHSGGAQAAWRPRWPRPWKRGPSVSPRHSNTCPTGSPRPKRSSPWPRWRTDTAAPTSPTSAPSRSRSTRAWTRSSASPREAQIPAEIYHLKTSGKKNWGRMPAVLKRIEEARAQGLDISADQYPYIAGQNGLDANLPLWVRDGGRDKLIERLKDPAVRARVKADLAKDDPSWENQYMGAGGAVGGPHRERREPRAQEVRRQDPRADRQGRGQGSRST